MQKGFLTAKSSNTTHDDAVKVPPSHSLRSSAFYPWNVQKDHIQVGKSRGRACQQPAHSLSGVASDALTFILRRENAPLPSALRFPASYGGQTLEPRRT